MFFFKCRFFERKKIFAVHPGRFVGKDPAQCTCTNGGRDGGGRRSRPDQEEVRLGSREFHRNGRSALTGRDQTTCSCTIVFELLSDSSANYYGYRMRHISLGDVKAAAEGSDEEPEEDGGVEYNEDDVVSGWPFGFQN